MTSFALYEAYGTRPYDWGDDPDRQKANTKEEEKDLGLLNEGMRYRDLETGVFLTRDPIGYGDGPNVYCYVHCNPITRFDPFGLKINWDSLPPADRAVLDELRAEDTVFNEQIMALDKSPHEWKFDNGMEDTIYFDVYEDETKQKKLSGKAAELADMNGTGYSERRQKYNPRIKRESLTDEKQGNLQGDGTAGTGSGGTLSWSSGRFRSGKDGTFDDKAVLAHEVQHATDINAGVMDRSRDSAGCKKSENRAVRRQNDSTVKRFMSGLVDFFEGNGGFPLLPSYAGTYTEDNEDGTSSTYEVEDANKPLPNATP